MTHFKNWISSCYYDCTWWISPGIYDMTSRVSAAYARCKYSQTVPSGVWNKLGALPLTRRDGL